MPIYEYECISCGERFEELQKHSDPPITECKLCKGNVRKLLGTPALQFKGTGWYITDYAGKSPAPGQAEGNGGEQKAEKKEEAKPAAKSKDGSQAPACKGGSCGKPSE